MSTSEELVVDEMSEPIFSEFHEGQVLYESEHFVVVAGYKSGVGGMKNRRLFVVAKDECANRIIESLNDSVLCNRTMDKFGSFGSLRYQYLESTFDDLKKRGIGDGFHRMPPLYEMEMLYAELLESDTSDENLLFDNIFCLREGFEDRLKEVFALDVCIFIVLDNLSMQELMSLNIAISVHGDIDRASLQERPWYSKIEDLFRNSSEGLLRSEVVKAIQLMAEERLQKESK